MAFKPAYKVGYVAYFELNIDYIVEKYCVNKDKPVMKCNGKCHLSKQLSLVSISNTNSDTDKAITNTLSEAFFPVYFEKYKEFKAVKYEQLLQKDFFDIQRNNYLVSLSVTSPPPKIA